MLGCFTGCAVVSIELFPGSGSGFDLEEVSFFGVLYVFVVASELSLPVFLVSSVGSATVALFGLSSVVVVCGAVDANRADVSL